MIQLREQFGIYLNEDETAALELMGMKEGDAVATCEAMKDLGRTAQQMKDLLLRDAYSLGLLERPATVQVGEFSIPSEDAERLKRVLPKVQSKESATELVPTSGTSGGQSAE